MKRLLTGATLCLALLLSFETSFAQTGPVLKFASFPPARSGMNRLVLKPWAEAVNKAAAGSVTVKLYMGGALGRSPLKQLKLVKDRVADMAFVTMAYTPGEFPDQSLFELPFLFRNAEEAAVTHWRLYERGLLEGYDRVKWTALFTLTPYSLHTRKAVRSIADLEGMKIRTAGPIQGTIVKALGGTPVGGVHIAKVAESLSRGVIDGTLAEWNGMLAFRIADAAHYHFDLPFTTVAVGTAMNKESFARIPDKGKAVIERMTGEALSRRHGQVFDTTASKNHKRFQSNKKHEFYQPTASQRAEITRRFEPIAGNWVADRPGRAQLLATAKRIIADIRKGN